MIILVFLERHFCYWNLAPYCLKVYKFQPLPRICASGASNPICAGMRNLNLNPTIAIFASIEMTRTKVQIYLMFLRNITNTRNSLLHFQEPSLKSDTQHSISLAVGLSRGFRDKRLYLALSVFWELRDKKDFKKFNFDLRTLEPC